MFPMGIIQTENPNDGTVEDIELGIPLGQAEKVSNSHFENKRR
jgi:hypothetical protein